MSPPCGRWFPRRLPPQRSFRGTVKRIAPIWCAVRSRFAGPTRVTAHSKLKTRLGFQMGFSSPRARVASPLRCCLRFGGIRSRKDINGAIATSTVRIRPSRGASIRVAMVGRMVGAGNQSNKQRRKTAVNVRGVGAQERIRDLCRQDAELYNQYSSTSRVCITLVWPGLSEALTLDRISRVEIARGIHEAAEAAVPPVPSLWRRFHRYGVG